MPCDATFDVAAALTSGQTILTLGGIETTLEFKTDYPLREWASFEAFFDPKRTELMYSISQGFADVAVKYNRALILDMHTWRASSHWFDKLDTPPKARQQIHRLIFDESRRIASGIHEASSGKVQTFIQGIIDPRGDGYVKDEGITVELSREYHRAQIRELKEVGADFIGAFTLMTSIEAIGIALEVNAAGMPCLISYTIDVDSRLPSGESLKEAIEAVDRAVGPGKLPIFLVNCIHPMYMHRIVEDAVRNGEKWVGRISGMRGNASKKSHAELDRSSELEEGDVGEFAKLMVGLHGMLGSFRIVGGCCGTSVKHCEEIAKLLEEERRGF